MTTAESRYSYIRAVREVKPGVGLEKFIEKAVYIGKAVLGFKDSTFLELPHDPAEEFTEGFEPVREGIGLAAATVYPAGKLRYTHFERLAKPEEGLNRTIARAYHKVTADSKHDRRLQLQLGNIRERLGISDDSNIKLRVNGVAVSTKPEYQHLGEEYAFSLTDGPAAQAVREYNEAIFRYVRSTGPGSEICRGQQASQDLVVPFVRLPREAEESQREEFASRITTVLFQNPFHIILGPVEWESRIR